MYQTRAKSAALRILLAATLIGAAGASQAAIYRGTWDPGYGAPFDDLGWKGTATFEVPDSCLSTNGACTASGIEVLSAEVQFYDVSDPNQTVLQTLVFDPSAQVYSATISGQQVTGVDTGFFAPVEGDTPVAQYNGNDYWFQLVFHGSQAQLFYTSSPSITPACATGGFGGPVIGVCGYSANIPDVTFTAAVPEPSTYMLTLAGLAGLAAARGVSKRKGR